MALHLMPCSFASPREKQVESRRYRANRTYLLFALSCQNPGHLFVTSLSSVARRWQTIILSFDTEPMKRDVWLDAMCSAISSAFVDPGLRHHHVLPLASEFNFRFGQQRGVGSRRSLLSLSAPVTTPLTPRDAAPQSNPSPSTAPLAYEIVVPEGAAPGDKLKMKLPSGGEVLVTIPAVLQLTHRLSTSLISPIPFVAATSRRCACHSCAHRTRCRCPS